MKTLAFFIFLCLLLGVSWAGSRQVRAVQPCPSICTFSLHLTRKISASLTLAGRIFWAALCSRGKRPASQLPLDPVTTFPLVPFLIWSSLYILFPPHGPSIRSSFSMVFPLYSLPSLGSSLYMVLLQVLPFLWFSPCMVLL